jgi:transposase
MDVAEAPEGTDGSATAKALDYSLRRWDALTRFVGDGQLPVDNNILRTRFGPLPSGRNNWLFAGVCALANAPLP